MEWRNVVDPGHTVICDGMATIENNKKEIPIEVKTVSKRADERGF